MIRPHKSRGNTAGIAIVAVLISAVVFLGIIVAITGTLSLSSRKSTSDQRVTLEAQYASESGLSRVMAESQNGLLKTWTSLLLNMTSTNSLDSTELQRIAKLFCNYSTATVLALPNAANPPADAVYCAAQPGVNQPNRYDLLATLIPAASYAIAAPPITGAVPTNTTEANLFWEDVFSDGPSGVRYSSTVSNGVSYAVNFGLEVVGVNILNGTKYRFRFKARDAVSTGQFLNGATVLSNRMSQRNFPEEYYVDIAPPKLSYFLSLTDSQGTTAGGDEVYFTRNTLLDGPIHTNGSYYFRGNPWFNAEVTSSGCSAYTTDASGVSTCSAAATTGFYNDGATNAAPTTFAVTGTQVNFPGYTVGAPVNATAPEFALQNPVANAKPQPWNYNGKYDAGIITLPQASTAQRTLAQQSGILIETSAAPAISGFYNSPTAEVYLQATTDGRSTATSFTKVANNAKNATGQIIQMKLNQKIQRCNAAATGIVINPLADTIIVGSNKTFSAIVSGQDTYSFEFAPTVKTVTWAVAPPSTLTAANPLVATAPVGATPATGKYTPTAGFAVAQSNPASTPVAITATTTRGNLSATANLTVNPIAPTVSLAATPSTLFYGGGTSSTLNWGFGSGNGPFTQLLEQSINGGTTWTTVAGAPTTSDGTTNRSSPVSPTVNTTYRLTAAGPTNLAAAAQAPITIAAPANPAISLNVSSSSNVPFGGGARTFTWSVTNVNATSTASGAGPGPFTYILEQSTTSDTTGYTPLTTFVGPAAGNTFSYTVPENLTASNITRRFRIQASSVINTVTYSGTSNRRDLTHLKPANPTVNANFPSGVGTAGTPLPYGGGAVTLQWGVTNATAAAAGTGPYTYQVQSSTNSSGGPWTNIGASTITTSQLLNPTGKIWYNVVATNTTTALTGADWEEVFTNSLPLPTIDLTSSSYNVPVVNSKVTLSYSVTNGANSKVTVGNTSGPLLQTIQTNATPNGFATTGSIANVNVPGPAFTDYTLTASNAVGTVTKTIRVYINNAVGAALPPPPVINTFIATPPTIYYPTGTSTLSWTLSGGAPTSLSIDNGVGNVLGSSSKPVTLTATTDYTLSASNAGGSVTLNTRVTVVPAVAPVVSLLAPTPNPVGYAGGNTTLSFSVTNPTGSGVSGAGTGPYTYVIQRNTGGGTWVTVATQTGQVTSGSYTYAAPANATSSDINYPFRVTATNTSTNLVGTSGTQTVTVSAVAVPTATISATPTSHPFNGGTSVVSWDVSNATAGAAGTGPYTYVVERQLPSNSFTTIYSGMNPSISQPLTVSGNTIYRVTATNTATGKVSVNLPTATVTIAPPPAPTITSLTATPNPLPSSAGGNVTFNWALGGGPVTTLSMDQGVGTVTGTSKSGVFVNVTKTYTLTAIGPGGTATRQVPVSVPLPPQTLNTLDKLGTDITRVEGSGTITPGWKATPTWTGGGTQPTVAAGDYTVTVSPAAGAVAASVDANGNVSLNIGAVSAQTPFTVSVSLTVNGVTKGPLTWKVTVTKSGGNNTIRPRARLTQTPLDCNALGLDGPVSYDWATFVDYYIDSSNNIWRREYPSQDQNAYNRPDPTPAPWVAQANKFNGVVYIDGGVILKGPSRTTASDPDTAAPSVANFAAMTLATDGKMTIVDDIKYENPVCGIAPARSPETVLGSNNGLVTPATCETVQANWSRNVLGLYSSGTAGIEIKTTQRNTTIQAISLASQGKIQVAGLPPTSNDACPNDLLPGNDLRSINIQGGLIQKTFGAFGKFDNTSNNTCGYSRTMTYDIRMRQPQYSPPGFPEAPNAVPTITIASSSNPTTALTVGQSLPLISGFSRIK